MNVAVVGAGALGLYYGAMLQHAGEDLHFLLRRDYEAIAAGGLRVYSINGNFELPRVNSYRTSEEIGVVDLVIIGLKTFANQQYAALIPPLLGKQTKILTLQNGLGNEEQLADLFGASLLTAKLSDHVWSKAEVKPEPFFYRPVGNANELVTKFEEHNAQIEMQLAEAGGKHGQLVAGIKKDVILSSLIADRPDRVVIYGWHHHDGSPIQPVYSGHIWWYVDYSHGIRFMNAQVLVDGRPVKISDLLNDPVLFRIVSDEEKPAERSFYPENID